MAVEALRILITGADGQLGQTFRQLDGERHFAHQLFFASKRELDIGNAENVRAALERIRPDILLNGAAYTAVDLAETEPEKAGALNAVAPELLGSLCAQKNIFLVHLSTDFLFDGKKKSPYTELDETSPLGVYGKSKLAGEKALLTSGARGVILRTAWLHSPHGKNFVKTMLRLGREKPELRVVNDQWGTPTSAEHLARGIMTALPTLLERVVNMEIFHLTDTGEATWFDLAVEALRRAGIATPVIPIPSSAYPTPAPRSPYTVLSKKKWTDWTGLVPPDWRSGLSYVGDLKS